MTRPSHLPLVLALVVLCAPLMNACVPAVVVGAAAGGALVATDRRSAGAQLDDQSIELKITTEMGTRYGDRIHLNVTSYNGVVLLTGEAPDQATRDAIAAYARGVDRVRAVHDEMVVGPTTDLSARTNDSYITSKVKTRFVEANKFSATHVKVVTERSVVYLMGIVSRTEADAAAQIAATTSGVARVVKLFEITG